MTVFFAYIPSGNRSGSQDTLQLICFPSHVREQVTKELREMNINFPTDAHSEKKMVPRHDKASQVATSMYYVYQRVQPCPNDKCLAITHHELFYVEDTFWRLDILFDGV